MDKQTEKKPVDPVINSDKLKKALKNPWKVAFLALVGVILGGLLFLGVRMSQEREPAYTAGTIISKEQEPTFQVALKKKQVNEIISFYLNDYLKDSGVKYEFYLENQAMLSGTFKILGHEMKFYLYFDPYVMEDGNVQLKANSVSIGNLSLPLSEIMKYVGNSFDLPSWVEVDPQEKTVLLHLNQFILQNGMYVQADKINLIDDDIRFNVYLPISNTSD